MPNVKSKPIHPIVEPSKSIMVNNGSFGIFICDSANPFDASVLANPQEPSGFGAIVELESLTMSQGIAEIFLKQVNEPLP
jgi:hypothetical protein